MFSKNFKLVFNLKKSKFCKGLIILKGLFCIPEFSQKTNKQIRCSSKNEFIHSFFWENSRRPKVLLKLSDLYQLECLKLKIQFQMDFNDYYFHWTRHARHHAIAYFQLQICSALWPELLIFVQKLWSFFWFLRNYDMIQQVILRPK